MFSKTANTLKLDTDTASKDSLKFTKLFLNCSEILNVTKELYKYYFCSQLNYKNSMSYLQSLE